MFEELEAKRVCRADLRSRSSSTSSSAPDEETQDLFQSRLAQLYGPLPVITTTADTQTDIKADSDNELLQDDVEDEFEFRLFATSADPISTTGVKKIILEKDDNLLDGNGSFLAPKRDPRYYFTGEIPPQQKKQFELAAISGEDVQRGLKIRHKGLEVPWRVSVIHVKVSNRQTSKVTVAEVEREETTAGDGKRKRMGKKMRILHRKREQARKELLLSEREKLAMKEAADREKKTKRNREKQLKKRAKEKAKKAGLGSVHEVDMSE